MTNPERKRLMVTGGAGFIGSHMVDEAFHQGYKVAILDNFRTGRRENVHPDAELHEVDLRNADDTDKVISGFNPDVIIHTAAQAEVPGSMHDPRTDLDINIIGMFNLLEALRKNRTGRELPVKIVYTNTGGAGYGKQDASKLPLIEDTLLKEPESFYTVSKVAAEFYLRLFGSVYGMEYFALRLANIYGPRQVAGGEAGIIAIFIGKMLAGEQPTIFGDGLHTRDYLYVADVVRAAFMGIGYQGPSTAVNISSGIETSNLQVFEAVRAAIGIDMQPHHGPDRPGDVRRNCLSNALANQLLGWQPTISLDEGILRTVEHQRQNSQQPKA